MPVALWLIMLHTTARATFGRWATSVSDVTGGESSSDNASAMRALTGGAARLGALAVVAALVVPVLVPHFPPRYLTDGLGRSTGSGGVGTVGFNDTIDLRNSLVNSDETPILRYTSTGPANVPLRAIATSYYSRGSGASPGGVGSRPARLRSPAVGRPRVHHDREQQRVLRAPRLAAPWPVVTPAIEEPPSRIDPVTRDIRVERTVESYRVTYSDVNPPVSKLRAAGAPTSPDILAEDLQIPDVAAELVQTWSDDVTAAATTDYDRAVAIQSHLRDDAVHLQPRSRRDLHRRQWPGARPDPRRSTRRAAATAPSSRRR